MSPTLTEPRSSGGTGRGADFVPPGYGDYGRGDSDGDHRMETAKLGLWLAMGAITMLFAAFTSAYLVRSAGQDWVPLEVPGILWLNSAILVLSSLTIEIARRDFNSWKPVSFRKWLFVTAVLGATFLVGQVMVWRQLSDQGIYLTSHPHSSFFYVLTAVHGAHLLAGVLVLFYVFALAARYRLTPGESTSPSVAATYWHFVDGLWLYLMVVLFYL
ncbi:MAG: cytochrome c oxidase subunit 3 [Vicinamibacteria bacterium]